MTLTAIATKLEANVGTIYSALQRLTELGQVRRAGSDYLLAETAAKEAL